MGALEQWDGHHGIGIINATRCMDRAIELSRRHGIGCVGLRHTNHWMRGGTYGLQAARAGCIGICWTNTVAVMPPWGSAEKKVGNNPLIVGVPRAEGPVLLDMAMSQYAYGKLEVLSQTGGKLPFAGGYDENGELTTDPDAILRTERPLPIGYWKGSGLALVLDLMATLISGGDSTREITQRGIDSGISQVFIAIAPQSAEADVNGRVDSIIEDFLGATPLEEGSEVIYPGQEMHAARKENLEKGVPVEPGHWQAIQEM
jgi:3-dehydro-L-gulonate 2-dehydrogenase